MLRQNRSLMIITAMVSASLATTAFAQICPIESSANCQAPGDSLEFRFDFFDNFRPTSDTISTLCVWGQYRRLEPGNSGTPLTMDCADEYGPQAFAVAIYHTEVDGLPGDTPIGSLLPAQFERTYVPGTAAEAAMGVRTFQFALTLDPPISGLDPTGNTCYWLSVAELVKPGMNRCSLLWQTADAIHDDLTVVRDFQQPGRSVGYGDMAFCLDSGVHAGGCGAPEGYCCSCEGTCSDKSFRDCRATNDDWHLGGVCADVPPEVCQTDPPVNDHCEVVAAPGFPTMTESSDWCEFDNFCADTDGVNPVRTERNDAVQIEGDVWFKYIAPAVSGELWVHSGRQTGGGAFDSVLAVYHDPENPEECVCPSDAAEHEAWLMWTCEDWRGRASDDDRLPFATGGFVDGPLDPGGCYMIRIGGKLGSVGSRGHGTTGAGMAPVEFIVLPWIEGDPAGHDKGRYVSFSLPPDNNLPSSMGVRVTPIVVPGFPQAEGVPLWVGPPRRVVDEDSSDPERSIWIAPLQCDPYTADWTSIGLVHVYGAEVVPGGAYEIDAAYKGWCLFDLWASYPVEPVTAKFADVIAPFEGGGSAQPDFNDIAAIVRKFTADPTAPSKVYAQLVPNVVFPDRPVNFKDIAAAVEAFVGTPFAEVNDITGPCACPSSVACGATACANDAQCPSGYCIDGFCTDACGRCRP